MRSLVLVACLGAATARANAGSAVVGGLASTAVALREELALGRGPRAHRAQLIALIDSADPHGSTRFLQRVDALIAA